MHQVVRVHCQQSRLILSESASSHRRWQQLVSFDLQCVQSDYASRIIPQAIAFASPVCGRQTVFLPMCAALDRLEHATSFPFFYGRPASLPSKSSFCCAAVDVSSSTGSRQRMAMAIELLYVTWLPPWEWIQQGEFLFSNKEIQTKNGGSTLWNEQGFSRNVRGLGRRPRDLKGRGFEIIVCNDNAT